MQVEVPGSLSGVPFPSALPSGAPFPSVLYQPDSAALAQLLSGHLHPTLLQLDPILLHLHDAFLQLDRLEG